MRGSIAAIPAEGEPAIAVISARSTAGLIVVVTAVPGRRMSGASVRGAGEQHAAWRARQPDPGRSRSSPSVPTLASGGYPCAA